MKKLPSKAQLRAELQQQVEDYLCHGGEVRKIPTGVSGRIDPLKSLPTPIFDQPKSERTPVTEVLAALEKRRSKKPQPKTSSKPKPREKVVYDDFGEPLRKVWVDK